MSGYSAGSCECPFSEINQLEFFSGLGGMRLALSYAGVKVKNVTAIDISGTANNFYEKAFPGDKAQAKDISALTLDWIENKNAAVWSMSPPCQPFTRQGNVLDVKDKRTGPFLHLMELLQETIKPPLAIILENVVNFEKSEALTQFKQVLIDTGYEFRAFLLSPSYFGYPNQRTRFYLVAKHKTAYNNSFRFPSHNSKIPLNEEYVMPVWTEIPGGIQTHTPCIASFMQPFSDLPLDKLLVTPSTLAKKGSRTFDVVGEGSTQSNCVTRSYGDYIQGSGSVALVPYKKDIIEQHQHTLDENGLDVGVMKPFVGRLRYFSPLEVARFMGFKPDASCASGLESITHDKNWSKRFDEDPIRNDLPVTENFALLENQSHEEVKKELEAAHGFYAAPGQPGHRCIPSYPPEYSWECVCENWQVPSYDDIPPKKMWQCLGNSLNPGVVAVLCRICDLHELIPPPAGGSQSKTKWP